MAEKQRPESQHPLSEAKKWAFGGGSMISTMTNSINNTFYYYFLTNVVGMSAALMGLVTTLSRAVGLIYGPISGAIMQRKEWKYGKYRTWLMFFYPASIVFFAMAYVNVQASPWVQWAYYFGVYIIAMLFGAYAEKAQLSLVPLMAHSQKERLELTSKRSAIATFGTVLYSLITVPLVTKLGGGDQGKGYLYVFIIYAVFGIIGYNVTAWSAKDYDLYKVAGTTEAKKVEKKEKQYPRSVYAASFFKNPPVMLLFFGDLMKATATMLYTGSIAYYFTNNIGDIGKLTIFLTVSNVLMLLGSLCAPILARKFDKKTCNTIAYTGFALGLICAAFVAPGSVWGVTLCIGFRPFLLRPERLSQPRHVRGHRRLLREQDRLPDALLSAVLLQPELLRSSAVHRLHHLHLPGHRRLRQGCGSHSRNADHVPEHGVPDPRYSAGSGCCCLPVLSSE